jgi:KDO2-lipid IV(A) lauroyltransferase
MRSTVHLPLRWQIAMGRFLGRIGQSFSPKARHVVMRNLEVCFPELSDEERQTLCNRHFESVGAAVAEMALGWFAPIERLRKLIRVEGREHLEDAYRSGKGIILFTAHFTPLETGVSILQDLCPRCSALYRPQKNEMIDLMIRRGRSRFAQEQIPKTNVRAMLRSLKSNAAVAYLPDHAYVGSSSELLPFFGEPAMTTTATSKLAKLSGAAVLPYFFRRLADDSGYVVDIGAPLEGFPSDDASADTRRLTGLLEEYIRKAPAQYLWTYRRFKGRPEGYPEIYGRD